MTARVHRAAREAGAAIRVSGFNTVLLPPLVPTAVHVDTIPTALDAELAKAT